MNEIIKVKAIVDHKRYYKDTFGVYGFRALEPNNQIKTDWRGVFVVSGNTFELVVGNEYELEIKPTIHPKYGHGYTFIRVKQNKLDTVEQQQQYIKLLLTEKQAEAIISKYPNDKILDLIKEDKFDYRNIQGIGEKTYKNIKKKLLNNLEIQEILVELSDLNISIKAIQKLIEHFGSAELVIQKVKENIYSLCEIKSFGFKTVDQYALNRGDDKTNPNRIKAAINYVLTKEEQEGHIWIDKFSLQEKLKDLLEIERKHIENVINNLDCNQFYVDDTRIARKITYAQEVGIKEKLLSLLKAKSKIHIDNYEEKIKAIEEEQGFQFTDEQKKAIEMSLKNNVLIINGKAGTGKSTTLKGIIKIHDKYQHIACALSGKAANVLTQMGLNGSTIHRALGLGKDEEQFKALKKGLNYDIIILDEAGMVNVFLFNKLIQTINEGCKFIIIGDSGQLESIDCGAVFRDLIKSGVIPTIELSKVQRQAEMSGILSSANKIREGKQIISSKSYGKYVFGELQDFHVYSLDDKDEILSLTLNIAEKFKDKNLNDFQIITGRRSNCKISVEELNKKLQEIFIDTSRKHIKHYNTKFYVGDKIIQTGNNYNAGEKGEISIFNGTIGKIVDIEFNVWCSDTNEYTDYVYIDFEGISEIIKYSNKELDQIELAYAISVHRSQGSTIKNVLFVFDYSSYMLLNRQFVYTGITRASKGCVMVCELNALRHAIRIDASEKRRTFLSELLK